MTVATALSVFASMIVTLRERPLNASTGPDFASYVMSSGFISVGTVPRIFNVFMSKIATLLPRPLLMKPLLSSGARAMPCTPGVSGISPTTVPLSRSRTTTCVAWET